MSDILTFVARAHAYAKRASVKPSTLSRKLLGNGKRLTELAQGKSLRVDTLERANALLDEMEAAA